MLQHQQIHVNNNFTSSSNYSENKSELWYLTKQEYLDLEHDKKFFAKNINHVLCNVHYSIIKMIVGLEELSGWCRSSRAYIGCFLSEYGYKRISVRTVNRHINHLVKLGYLESEQSFVHGRKSYNKYTSSRRAKIFYHSVIKKNKAGVTIILSTKSVDNFLAEQPEKIKMAHSKNQNGPPLIYMDYMDQDQNIHDLSIDMDMGIPARGEQQDHEWVSPNDISHIEEIEITKTEVKMIDVNEFSIPIKILNNRFSGNGTQLSIANGLLGTITSDPKRRLAFANALVAAMEENIHIDVPTVQFSILANEVLSKTPITKQEPVCKIDSYEKLKEQGYNIPISKPDPAEEHPLPYSVKQQLGKFFYYHDFDHMTHAIKEIRKKYNEPEGNLINLIESVHTGQMWLRNEKNQKKVDLGMLVRTQYKKLKEKYKW